MLGEVARVDVFMPSHVLNAIYPYLNSSDALPSELERERAIFFQCVTFCTSQIAKGRLCL